MRLAVLVTLLFYVLLAQGSELSRPDEAVKTYYKAMNSADIEALKEIMVPSSFKITMEVWALSKALKDKSFAKKLKRYGTDKEIDLEVQEAVRTKLLHASPKEITDLRVIALGKSRCMVRYKEDGKQKQLFTSLDKQVWKIDYKAGRKID